MDDRVSPKIKRRPFLAPDFVRAMLAGHSALGLAFAALIYIVCLSGTLSVFIFELQRWEQPDAPHVAAPISADIAAAATRNGYAQSVKDNAAHDLTVTGPSARSPWLLVNYRDHETNVDGAWVANDQGELVARVATPFSDFIGNLHMHLHLPRTWGLFLVGLTGVALLSSLISGLLSHPRLFKDAFALRWGGSKRLQEADLHNRLGVWGLPFHVVVSLTGALLGLSTLIVGVLAMAAYDGNSEAAFAAILGPQPGPSEVAAPLPDVAAMIRAVEAETPGATFTNLSVGHVGHAEQLVSLGISTPQQIAFSEAYHFDGDGRPRGVTGLENGSVGQQILGVLQPLHFGWFGGLTIKLIYGLLGLGLTIVTHTGVTIWLARRRDKGRAVPGWERVWSAVGWGQPFGFGVAAVLALAGQSAAVILAGYLVACAAALGVAAVAADADKTTRALRWLSALSFVAAIALHLQTRAGRLDDVMSFGVDAAIALAAVLIVIPALRGSRRALSAA